MKTLNVLHYVCPRIHFPLSAKAQPYLAQNQLISGSEKEPKVTSRFGL